MMEENSCRLDFVRGNAEFMAKERAICRCKKCTTDLLTPGFDIFKYEMKEKEIRDLRQTVVVQNINLQLRDFSQEEKKKILEEVMINEELTNINVEAAGPSPGYSKPHSEVLSVL